MTSLDKLARYGRIDNHNTYVNTVQTNIYYICYISHMCMYADDNVVSIEQHLYDTKRTNKRLASLAQHAEKRRE